MVSFTVLLWWVHGSSSGKAVKRVKCKTWRKVKGPSPGTLLLQRAREGPLVLFVHSSYVWLGSSSGVSKTWRKVKGPSPGTLPLQRAREGPLVLFVHSSVCMVLVVGVQGRRRWCLK